MNCNIQPKAVGFKSNGQLIYTPNSWKCVVKNPESTNAIAIGTNAGGNTGDRIPGNQKKDSIAIGRDVGLIGLGENSIGIGQGAFDGNNTTPPDNSIAITADGSLNPTTKGFFVSPLNTFNDKSDNNQLFYNSNTKEILYYEPGPIKNNIILTPSWSNFPNIPFDSKYKFIGLNGGGQNNTAVTIDFYLNIPSSITLERPPNNTPFEPNVKNFYRVDTNFNRTINIFFNGGTPNNTTSTPNQDNEFLTPGLITFKGKPTDGKFSSGATIIWNGDSWSILDISDSTEIGYKK